MTVLEPDGTEVELVPGFTETMTLNQGHCFKESYDAAVSQLSNKYIGLNEVLNPTVAMLYLVSDCRQLNVVFNV